MTADTFWNGERCDARKVTVIVADDGRFPKYWAAELVGTERAAVEVTYLGETFYLDNDDGQGWSKVTVGKGAPGHGHRSLEIERVVE